MKHLSRTFCASALVMALSAITYAQGGGTARGTVTPAAGSTQGTNEKEDGSPDVTRSGVGEPSSSPPAARPNRGKANGLNMGTHSGANSDVNRPRNGLKEKSQ